MGRLQKLLFCLCLPLSSCFCSASITEAIAASSQQAFSQRENQRPSQTAPIALPIAFPVARRQLTHLKPSSSCPPIPPSASFNSQQLDKQLQRYLRFVAQSGKPDILIVGSSRALQGIDPIVLQQTLESRGYRNLKIFNFGVNGATAQLVDLLLREILSPDQLPRLLLWGDGVRAFNSGRTDITYKRAIASQSYQLLTAGIRPILPPIQPSQVALNCTAITLKLFDHETTSKPKYFDFVPSLAPALNSQQLYGNPLKTLLQPEPPAALENRMSDKLQETTGFQPLSDQFQPETYFQQHPKVQGEYDADYRDFRLDGSQTEAFNRILEFAKARQIPIVFVNLPLTKIYLDETRTVSEKQFYRYLQRFTRSHSLSVYNLSQRWLEQNGYFTDPSHLNRYGAAAVAAELGKVMVMPETWLQDHRPGISPTYKP